MSHPTLALIHQRTSVNRFDPAFIVDDATIEALIDHATQAPSAYNAQNWRFIAVRTADNKARLCDMAYGQPKVREASVTFIVCGRLAPHRGLRALLQPFVDAGHLPAAGADAMAGSAAGTYEGHAQLQRDEAIRSASLAAMTLMLAAQAMGLASGPMIGFDPAQVHAGFALGEDEVPAMLVTVGSPAAGNWPRKPRRPVDQVLTLV
jgi:nitroreductase